MNASQSKFNVLVLIFFTILSRSNAQSISPATFNNGGGFSGGSEWSIGESVSIGSFSASSILLTTGVLQPLSNVVTSIHEYGPLVFGQQITIGPNPASNYLDFKANFNQIGSLHFQMLDAKSKILITKEQGSIFSVYQTRLQLDTYASGIYYIKVYFKPISGKLQTGVYKIIKL
jgi:hypothetical protein